jgi:malate dehydrogenase (oxaloacetate-decarboxylating)(NADP+)
MIRITDEMYFAAAQALAAQVTDEDLQCGRVFPPAAKMREVAASVATAVAEVGYAQGLAQRPRPADLAAYIRKGMYRAEYATR